MDADNVPSLQPWHDQSHSHWPNGKGYIEHIYVIKGNIRDPREQAKRHSVSNVDCGGQVKVAAHLGNTESFIDFLEDANKALQANPPATHSEVEILWQKVDDLENRSRWNNLRFMRFLEGCEGQDAVASLHDVPQMLNMDFPEGLKIDCVHRSLARHKPDGQPPRAILARFLRFQEREQIAEAARKMGKVSWDGHHIMVFPDYSKLVTEKRANASLLTPRKRWPTLLRDLCRAY